MRKPFEVAGLPSDEVKNFVAGTHSDPFRLLGPHGGGDDLEIRVFCPDARRVELVVDGHANRPITSERIQQDGFFCATVLGATRDFTYQLRITRWDGSQQVTRNPYQYGPIMGEVDLHLFAEGQHWKIYDKFGAHLRTVGDAAGDYLAVLGPSAARVSVARRVQGGVGRGD